MVTCSAEVMGSNPSSDGFFGVSSEKKIVTSIMRIPLGTTVAILYMRCPYFKGFTCTCVSVRHFKCGPSDGCRATLKGIDGCILAVHVL